MESAWKEWYSYPNNWAFRAFPLITTWGGWVWLARNRAIFQDKISVPECIVAKALAILAHVPQEKGSNRPRIIVDEKLDPSKTRAYFDGASNESVNRSGGGFVLFLFVTHSFYVKMGFGPGTNNQVELLA